MTGKQERFVREYLACGNGARAARLAGYLGKGAASRMLKSPEVRAALAAANAREPEQRRQRVLKELEGMAYGMASDESGSDMKYASKLRALELLAKLLGMFEKQPEPERSVVLIDDIPRPEEDR